MNGLLTNKLFSGVLGFVIVGVTVFSSVTGIVKVASSFEKPKQVVPEVRTVQSGPENKTGKVLSAQTAAVPKNNGTGISATTSPAPLTHPSGVNAGGTTGVKTNGTVTAPTTQTSISAVATSNPNDCIVTLFGKQYNVAPLRTTHSGGDVFKCGTDMTTVYQGQHGTDVSRMQPYLVIPSSTTGGTTGGSTSGSIGGTAGSVPTGSTGGTSVGSRDDDDSDDRKASLERDLREVESENESSPDGD